MRVYSNGFGGYGDGNTGQTWGQFLADPGVGTTPIGYITIDLDAGSFTSTQVMDTTDFDVNGAIYAPEPAGAGDCNRNVDRPWGTFLSAVPTTR